MSALPPLPELYETNRRRVLAIVTRILGDRDDAEDVVQDVFVRLHTQPARFDGRATSTTWLHRVLVNSSINSLRAKRRRGRLELEPEEDESPQQIAEDKERHGLFMEALGTLSKQHQQVITLRDVKGYSYPEIARLLALPEGTVKSALNRGRTKLLKAMRLLAELDS